MQATPSAQRAHSRKLAYYETPGERPRQFFLYRPRNQRADAPIVVTVHGIARNAAAHAYRLIDQANRFGLVVAAPLFDKLQYGQYQQLQDPNTGVRSDLALLDIVDAVSRLTQNTQPKVLLFGYSGGAQFTHRFVMAHPHRVASAVHVAAGWYTFPNETARYPEGLRVRKKTPFQLNLAHSLKVPQHVLVGSLDAERDASLRKSRAIDRLQGRTRVERAQNWVAAMASAARGIPGAIEPTFALLPDVGHSFAASVERASLPARAFDCFAGDAGLAAG